MRPLENLLRDSAWSTTLDPEEMDLVVASTHQRCLRSGAHAIRCGDPASEWVGVIDGLLKLSIAHADGRVSTLSGVAAGGWVGEGSLLRGGPWRFDAIAVGEVRVAGIPRHVFEQLLGSNLAFNRYLMTQMNARLSLLITVLEYERMFGPDMKVARALANLYDPVLNPRTGPFLHLSQEEIGLLAGVSRQRANEALRRLQREGLLRVEFAGVAVLDVAGLRSYTGQSSETRAPGRGAAAA